MNLEERFKYTDKENRQLPLPALPVRRRRVSTLSGSALGNPKNGNIYYSHRYTTRKPEVGFVLTKHKALSPFSASATHSGFWTRGNSRSYQRRTRSSNSTQDWTQSWPTPQGAPVISFTLRLSRTDSYDHGQEAPTEVLRQT